MINGEKLQSIEDILYSENETEIIDKINNINDSKMLHVLTGNYNLNDGFNIPNAILNNENCDLGTALLMFHLADGYTFLTDVGLHKNSHLLSGWKLAWWEFIKPLFHKIVAKEFPKTLIKYIPDFTNSQKIKLKKVNDNIPSIVIDGVDGEEVLIPNL